LRVKIDVEIPDEVIEIFVKEGMKREEAEAAAKELLERSVQMIANELPEIFIAMKTQALPFSRMIEHWIQEGAKIGEELEDKYRKFMCPSCGEVIMGLENLKKHWKEEGYTEEDEYCNFEVYKSAAEYEYETHVGWKKQKKEQEN